MKVNFHSFLAFLISVVMVVTFLSCDRRYILNDPQGNKYRTIQIRDQEWMGQNLLLDVGDGSYCYEDDPEHCVEMGRLYTWEAAQKASSQMHGWHLPTKQEWQELIAYCGADTTGYDRIMSETLGFNPQWSGVRLSTGTYKGREFNGVNYWSSTVADTNSAYAYSVAILSSLKIISPHNYPKDHACSVRLIRD